MATATATRQLIKLATKVLTGAGNLRRASVREFCSTSPGSLPEFDQFRYQLLGKLTVTVSPSVVALLSYISAPETREIPHSATRASGVFVDRNLIVTSASVVGRISTVYDSDSSSVLHNCFLARTIALTNQGKSLRTTPVAVNFAGDVAVLEVVDAEGNPNLPPPCKVANVFAETKSPLVGIARHANCTAIISLPLAGNRRAPKAPWPLANELGWVDYGVKIKNVGVGVSLPDISGSPWFNYGDEVVGIASWTAAGDGVVSSYAVPPLRIKSVIDYAKTKRPHDPIVMDRWINAHTIPDGDADIIEECMPDWTMNVITRMVV
ncbi:hypothetical protein C2S51_001781 [Perilla frutescens var. frutescens]|nr:hypothetical protein C2S51_001781 [Perilla frutescens var. frutescens]